MIKKLTGLFTALAVAGLLLAACAPAAPPAAPSPTAAAAAKAAAPTATPPPAPTPVPATPTPRKVEKIVVALPTTGFTDICLVTAKKKGFYTEEGLEVDTPVIASDVAIKAMVGGSEIDYTTSWGSSIRAAVQGVAIKAVVAELGRTPHILVTRPEIKSVADLRGKKIGVASVGGTIGVLAGLALKKAGVDPEKEVTMVAIPDSATRLVSVRTGIVDASVIDPAFAVAAEKEGLSLLVRFRDVVDIVMSGVITTDKRIKENPDQVMRVVRATVKGCKFVKDPANRAEVVKIMTDEFKLAQDVADKTYDLGIDTVTEDGIAREEAVQTDIDLSLEALKRQDRVPLSQVIDYSFVRKLKEGR